MDIIKWIENWYFSNCDGNWEHSFGIEITTLDNPGWQVKIDLTDTSLANLSIDYQLIEKSENEWYGFEVKKKIFIAAGDVGRLEFLLLKFREIVITENLKNTNPE